ncbi:putative lipoprotein, partial [Yersinia pestis PY-03]
MSLLLLL